MSKPGEMVVVSENDEYSTIPIDNVNVGNVRNLIVRNENPHPAVVVTIIALMLIMFYYLYVSTKPSLSGMWVTEHGKIYINHNRWNDSVIVEEFDNYLGKMRTLSTGYVRGDGIALGIGNKVELGVVYRGSIFWVHGAVWKSAISIA